MGCGAVSPANRYCVAEVFLDEMREFLALAVETLDLMLKPFISVLEKSAVKLLDLASASETLRGNRKILFGFHDDFLWLENDLEKSRVHISTEELENGSSENVISTVVSESTEQVEVNNGCVDGLSQISTLRRRRNCLWSEPSNVVNDASLNGDVVENKEMDFDECVISYLQRQFQPFKSLDPAHSRSKLLESSPTRNFP
ncbi:unnamed protein product [Musa hybrid cultivar]